MWRDTREARLRRYRDILKGSPRLYGPAEASGEGTVPDRGTGRPEESEMPPAQHREKKEKENLTEAFVDAVEQGNGEAYQKTFGDVCDYVLAPALNGFVLWVLKKALDSGKKRLYFLARDGYLMYRAALVYCEKLKLPIECRYLSCSRYSIRIPVFHLDMDGAMDYICRGGIDVTMTKILNRAGLTKKEQEEVLAGLDTGYENDAMIPYADLAEIRKILEQDARFMECVKRNSEEAMPYLEGYLIQEGLFDGTPSALVDSGWVGSMQKVLNELLEHIQKKNQINGRANLEGYYWGLYELPAGVKPEEYHCYYFSPWENLKEKVYFSNCLFEGIFSAPHGMTTGYAHRNAEIHAAVGTGDFCPPGYGEDAGYYPVYAEISKEQKQFMETVEQRLLGYTGKLAETLCVPEPGDAQKKSAEEEKKGSHSDFREVLDQIDFKHDREIICQLLELFMGEPTALEAEVYGSLHFSDDVLDYGGHQMAEPMTEEELTANHLWHKALVMLGVQKKHVKESAWYEGSAVRSGRNVKRHLRRYAGYKYMLYLRKKYQMRNPSRHDKR